MLLRALIGIYFEDHAEQTHTLCGQNTGETDTYRLALNVNVRMDSESHFLLLYTNECTGIISVFRPKEALHKPLQHIMFT
jgi:hypothetical protein